jgi:hypothetical protein
VLNAPLDHIPTLTLDKKAVVVTCLGIIHI